MRWAIGVVTLSVCLAVIAGSQVRAASVVPSTSLTTWAPGVRGIPTRTTVCATVDAASLGNGRDEASGVIQAAINSCPVGQVVQLSAGTFRVDNYVLINKGITLRGAG